MSDDTKVRPDAFKAVMAASQQGRQALAHQSLGREATPEEEAFADALMRIYARGVSGPEGVAAALSEEGVVSPVSGKTNWTAENVAADLAALNADLDKAYEQNGFGG